MVEDRSPSQLTKRRYGGIRAQTYPSIYISAPASSLSTSSIPLPRTAFIADGMYAEEAGFVYVVVEALFLYEVYPSSVLLLLG
jgi:hypothetical protein